MYIAWFAVFGRLYLLLYHVFHSLLCTLDVPMYTAGESVFYSGWCITGRRVSPQNQLNIRSFHARWKAHYSPVS